MLLSKQVFKQSLLIYGRRENLKRFLSTSLNYATEPEKKLYPLEGIRVLDLTRIGKLIIYKFPSQRNLMEMKFHYDAYNYSCWAILHNDFIRFGC